MNDKLSHKHILYYTSTSIIILDKVDRGQYLIKNISESDTGRSSQRQNYEFRSEVLKVLSLCESRMEPFGVLLPRISKKLVVFAFN